MKARRILISVLAATFGIFFFLIATFLLIPSTEILKLAQRALSAQGLSLSAADVGKSFPIGLSARKLSISSKSGEILKFDRLVLRLKILPLIAGRLVVSVDGDIGKGKLHIEAESTRSGRLDIDAKGIRLEDVPFFTTIADTNAKGNLRLKGNLKGKGSKATGNIQMEVKDVDLRGVRISGMPLPDAQYRTFQGMLRTADGRVKLESVTLEGEGLYVRLSGDFPAGLPPASSPLNLTLEMMPKPEFLEKQKFIFLLLAKYTVTPGHYKVPIRGTLAKPEL